ARRRTLAPDRHLPRLAGYRGTGTADAGGPGRRTTGGLGRGRARRRALASDRRTVPPDLPGGRQRINSSPGPGAAAGSARARLGAGRGLLRAGLGRAPAWRAVGLLRPGLRRRAARTGRCRRRGW